MRYSGSLRRRLALFFAMLGGLGLLMAVALAIGFLRLADAQRLVAETYDPVRSATRDQFTAMLDHEAALRGSVLTDVEEYAERALEAEQEALALVDHARELLAGDPTTLALLDEVYARYESWRAGPAAELAALAATDADVTTDDLEASREEFAGVREAYERYVADVRDATVAAEDRAQAAARTLGQILLLGAVVLTGAGVVLWIGLRRSVIEPLEGLGSAARRVSDGELSLEVTSSGPRELARLAEDIDAMRERIVADLAAVEVAREDLARTNAELEQFAYVASHDLQEPLRKVASFCQLLQKRYGGQLDDRADEYIAFAVDGAKRMQQLITDLLDFSRVGRLASEQQPVDLGVAAAVATADLGDALEAAGATVELGELPTVLGDRSLLTSMLQNLIGNAAKFRDPDRPVRIRVGAERVGDEWHLWCADNGIGIEPRFAERVFLVFQRLHGRDVYEGTGIGLALCRKIIEHHGGRIWIDPDVAEGTTVRWTLPAIVDDDAAAETDQDGAETDQVGSDQQRAGGGADAAAGTAPSDTEPLTSTTSADPRTSGVTDRES